MTPDKKTKTVLVVDDEPENRRTYREILEGMDYRVLTQFDGNKALETLREGTAIDLVITDFQMPGMNGVEFITQLRKSRPKVPVIMVTAYGNVEVYTQSVSLGVFEFMHKPVRMEELKRIVQQALGVSCTEERGNGEQS